MFMVSVDLGVQRQDAKALRHKGREKRGEIGTRIGIVTWIERQKFVLPH
jgi:hypothetical protein